MLHPNKLIIDIIFFGYIVLILPAVSFIYFAISLTNWEAVMVILGVAILWGIMIPYPVFWYVKRRICTTQ